MSPLLLRPTPSALAVLRPLVLLPLLLLLIHADAGSAATTTKPSDAAVLEALKSSVSPSSIPPWSCLASWDFKSADPCARPRQSYFTCGVICTTDIDPSLPPSAPAQVAAITLDPAGYAGTLTPLVAHLTALTHLDLSGNSFRGRIPAAILALPALRTLTLASNAFSGPIPQLPPGYNASSSALVSLDLSRNKLSGPIPTALASLTALRTLDLSFNAISGTLPPQLPPGLVEIAVRGNRLSGPLPRSAFEPLQYLEVVELGGNAISGTVEGWFFRMPSLQQVDLANNSLTYIDVAGRAATPKTNPTSTTATTATTTNLTHTHGSYSASRLVALDLSFNRIDGSLPVELAAFPSLTSLSLSQNQLKGGIPPDYCAAKKGEPFRRIFLDGNFLNGTVPPGFVAGQVELSGSFADNCLDGCPRTVPLCSPAQKSASVCSQVYGPSGRHAR